jgi:hypothetical protein
MYNLLVTNNKVTKKDIEINLAQYLNSKNYILKSLEPYEFYINNFTSINFEDLKNITNFYISNKLRINYNTEKFGIDTEKLKRLINVLCELNKNIKKLEKQKEIIKTIPKFEVYKDILNTFNETISDEIVYKGYTFNLPFNLSDIKITKVDCSKYGKKIDWNATNKKKKEILDKGGILYKVTERDDKFKIIKDNGGEKYIVYFDKDFDYLWNWVKSKVKVLNSAYYRFKPTYYNNTSTGGKLGNVNKLSLLKTSNSELLKNFI